MEETTTKVSKRLRRVGGAAFRLEDHPGGTTYVGFGSTEAKPYAYFTTAEPTYHHVVDAEET